MASTNPLDATQANQPNSANQIPPTTTVLPAVAPLKVDQAQFVAATPAGQSTVSNATGATMNATLAQQDQNKGTVQGQITNIIDANSPLMQRAAARASSQMASRGLQNSSLAVGAGQAALYDAATPIAGADAASNNQFALSNQQAQNQASQVNTANEQQAGMLNAQQNTQNSQFNTANEQQTNLTNAQAHNSLNQFNTGQTNAMTQSTAQLTQQNEQFNATQLNAANLKLLDQAGQENLAKINNTFAQTLKANEGAAQIYDTYQKAMNGILTSNLSPEAKQAAIQQTFDMMNAGLAMYSSVDGLNINGLLTVSGDSLINSGGTGATLINPSTGSTGTPSTGTPSTGTNGLGPKQTTPTPGPKVDAVAKLKADQAAWDAKMAEITSKPLPNNSNNRIVALRERNAAIKALGSRPV